MSDNTKYIDTGDGFPTWESKSNQPAQPSQQEGETVKQLLERLYGQKVGQMDAKLFNQFFVIEVAEAYASQQTATALAELQGQYAELLKQYADLIPTNERLGKLLTESQARIKELESGKSLVQYVMAVIRNTDGVQSIKCFNTKKQMGKWLKLKGAEYTIGDIKKFEFLNTVR